MMPKQSFYSPAARQRGTTLIEVLIALLVLSVGLLGMAGLQMTSLKSNHSAYYRSQASLLAYDIADRMRANRKAALDGEYDLALSAQTCNPALAPSGSLAARDKAGWLNTLACHLSSDARAQISRNGKVFTITIQWNDNRGRVETALETDRQNFTYRTQL